MPLLDGHSPASKSSEATDIASDWLSNLSAALTSEDVDGTTSLILPDGWLRDLLTFTWDLRSRQGHDEIKTYLSANLAATQITNIQLDTRDDLSPHIETTFSGIPSVLLAFTFETPIAWGRGYAQLLPVEGGQWKALFLMVMVSDWKEHEEATFESGIYSNHNLAWEDVKQQRTKEIEDDPQVVILGAGQTGLQVAARFKQMNIRTLLLDQEPIVGDVWRKRYPTLVLHTPRTHHTLLYQPYPSNWPVWTPKEKLASWIEQYAQTHDAVVWNSSRIDGKAVYDDKTQRWTVHVNRNGSKVVLRPSHLVMAIGIFGDPVIPSVPGADTFNGDILHASTFGGATPYKGKKVIVVGAANSAADICQDLVFRGASSVTMVQRSATGVISGKFNALRLERAFPPGVPTEVTDFKNSAMPLGLLRRMMIEMQPLADEFDKEMIDGLKKAGFHVYYPPDGSGQLLMVFDRGSGYFVDVGCAQLICDGRVKIKHGTEIERLDTNNVFFKDGTKLDADAIIFATGYGTIKDKLRPILGDEVIDKITDIWGTDGDGEVRAGYKPSGQPGLWFAGGDFSLSRALSKQLALQIKAIELGFTTQK